jgi:hypothetical protein
MLLVGAVGAVAPAAASGASTPTGGAVRPPHATSSPLQPATGSWAGDVDTGAGYVFNQVGGDWTVPTVTSSVDAAASTWIGLGGVGSTAHFEIGTTTQVVGGVTTYSGFYELENPGGTAGRVLFPAGDSVLPGDQVEANLVDDGPTWQVNLVDLTENWNYDVPVDVTYSGDRSSAEWVEDATGFDGSTRALADFGHTTFTELGAIGQASGAGYPTVQSVSLTSAGHIEAFAGQYQGTSGSGTVTVTFGPPPAPTVTGLSVRQGLISGGTPVTISGTNLTGATKVTFGTTSAHFTVTGDGTITTTSPAGAVGAIQVRVTTPSGESPTSQWSVFAYARSSGYWLVGADGGIFSFGGANFYGSTGNLVLQRPVVGITPTPDDGGYWLVASDGGIFAFGDSTFEGSMPGLGIAPAGTVGAAHSLDAPIIGMVPSTTGHGYFMVGEDGGVFAFGDARFEGSCPGIGGCPGIAAAVVPDSTGYGYWLVMESGAVHAFGDATTLGGISAGPDDPVSSAARTPNGQGYWLLQIDGTVTGFGNAARLTDPGSFGPTDQATAIFPTADGNGYRVASEYGEVAVVGDATWLGDMSSADLNAPVIAATGW